MVGAVPNSNIAVSILEKLQVPLGWCSSGFRANEYTLIILSNLEVYASWEWHCVTIL